MSTARVPGCSSDSILCVLCVLCGVKPTTTSGQSHSTLSHVYRRERREHREQDLRMSIACVSGCSSDSILCELCVLCGAVV
jgi:hypothetical protein